MKAERYAKQVAKYLKCSGNRKREIKKEILSDFQAALEKGKTPEQITRDMGEPKALAKELNEGFSETEKKAAGRAKVLRILICAAVILGALACLAWWALPKTRQIGDSKIFSESAVKERTEQIIGMFDKKDYKGLQEYVTEPMREVMEEEVMEQNRQYIGSDWGEPEGISSIYMAEISQFGGCYAVVQATAAYENVSVVYTLSFDEDMKLAGFYMR